MKQNDIIKQLIPGMIMGVVLGGLLNTLAGVNKTEIIPNVINAILACAVPTLLNGTIVLLGTSKVLQKKLSFPQAILKNLIFVLIAGIIGAIYSYGFMYSLLKIDLRAMSILLNTILLSAIGIIVSTILGYFAIKTYENSTK